MEDEPEYVTYRTRDGINRHKVLLLNDDIARCQCGVDVPLEHAVFHEKRLGGWAVASLCRTCHRGEQRPWETEA